MKCLECGEEMLCVDDVNDISTKIDFLKCEKCGATAEITYDNNIQKRKEMVVWKKYECTNKRYEPNS